MADERGLEPIHPSLQCSVHSYIPEDDHSRAHLKMHDVLHGCWNPLQRPGTIIFQGYVHVLCCQVQLHLQFRQIPAAGAQHNAGYAPELHTNDLMREWQSFCTGSPSSPEISGVKAGQEQRLRGLASMGRGAPHLSMFSPT